MANPPAVGVIEDGHRFKGGDPANPSSWEPVGPTNAPGVTQRPEYGSGAYETPDGAILRAGKGGGIQVIRGAQTAGAEARTRLQLGLGPSIEAERNMGTATKAGNPLNTRRGAAATLLSGKGDNNSVWDGLAKVVGGQEFQNAQQAAKTFESAFMPILSGAAVSPSEASRLIRASLPQMGDSPATLERKALNRKMMINGAAKLSGEPPPFPDVGAQDFGGQRSGNRMKTTRHQAEDANRARSPSGGWKFLGTE